MNALLADVKSNQDGRGTHAVTTHFLQHLGHSVLSRHMRHSIPVLCMSNKPCSSVFEISKSSVRQVRATLGVYVHSLSVLIRARESLSE